MKYKILPLLLFVALAAQAQQKQKLAFAITSSQQGHYAWTDIRLIDLNTGVVVNHVFENSKSDYQAFSARDGKAIKVKNESGVITDNSRMPFSSFSAACAFDKKHNRLYYTPMFVNELRYIDLNAKSPKIFYFDKEALSVGSNLQDEANHITRMAIGADGSGYAISNDGKRFIKFTTGNKPAIIELGSLRDDEANSTVSIHNRCTSWGGDMVAAADGSLYLFSANRSVFKVDVNKRTALYKGTIEGLPATYTTNGVAVTGNNTVVVTSANSLEGYFEVDMKDLKAKKIAAAGAVFNASDLANAELLFQNEVKADRTPLVTRVSTNNPAISIYPNPVTEKMFRVSFDIKETGRYSIQVVDLMGRLLQMKEVSIANKGQVVEVELNNKLAKGVYLVKVLSNNNRAIYADKVIVE